jgi:hypothetical protein
VHRAIITDALDSELASDFFHACFIAAFFMAATLASLARLSAHAHVQHRRNCSPDLLLYQVHRQLPVQALTRLHLIRTDLRCTSALAGNMQISNLVGITPL